MTGQWWVSPGGRRSGWNWLLLVPVVAPLVIVLAFLLLGMGTARWFTN